MAIVILKKNQVNIMETYLMQICLQHVLAFDTSYIMRFISACAKTKFHIYTLFEMYMITACVIITNTNLIKY